MISFPRRGCALWLALTACGQTATGTAPPDSANAGHDTAQYADAARSAAASDTEGAHDAADGALEPCPANCDDANLCTYDLCQPTTASCLHLPLPASTTCTTDNDACTAQWCDGANQCVVYSTDECQ
jgi:hypothetical protein